MTTSVAARPRLAGRGDRWHACWRRARSVGRRRFADAKAVEHLSATINERRSDLRTHVPPEAAGEGKPVRKGKRA